MHSSISEWKGALARTPQQAYGEIVGIMAINQPELKWPGVMLADLLKDPAMIHARVGAAYAAVNLWENPEFRKAASKPCSGR